MRGAGRPDHVATGDQRRTLAQVQQLLGLAELNANHGTRADVSTIAVNSASPPRHTNADPVSYRGKPRYRSPPCSACLTSWH